MKTAQRPGAVSVYHKVAYAAPAFALAVVGIPIYVYLPKFYTDVVGVHIKTLGYLILAVRLFDALTDPALGFISDRTKTRFGRRRPYIATFSLLLALCIYLLFNPPEGSHTFETAWFGICIFALFLFWTAVEVPYESLGPEITFDYNERTSLFSFRDGALIAGTLLAASSPALVQEIFNLGSESSAERMKFFWISVLYAPMVALFCWWCVLTLKERPAKLKKSSQIGLWEGLLYVGSNRPFVILLVSYTIAAFGSNLPATLILYYVEYVIESSKADLFLLIYFVTGIVFLPGWVLISRILGKKWTWISSMAVNTGAFVGVFFLGPGDVWIYGVLVFISGIGFGATLAIPSAMQADVIDYDELLTGDRREGAYVGLWSISKKLAAALGVGTALFILGLFGYQPNVVQSEGVIFALRLLYAMVPSICNLMALTIALFYPISTEVHAEILANIKKREMGEQAVDPLKQKHAPIA